MSSKLGTVSEPSPLHIPKRGGALWEKKVSTGGKFVNLYWLRTQ